MKEINLKPGWLRDDVQRAEARMKYWLTQNDQQASESQDKSGSDCSSNFSSAREPQSLTKIAE